MNDSFSSSAELQALLAAQHLAEIFRDLDEQQETPRLRGWFDAMLKALRQQADFPRLLEQANGFTPLAGMPVFNHTLQQTAAYKLSLMGLHISKPLPLHDHPGYGSAQWILAGRLRIRQFANPSDSAARAIVHLQTVADQVYAAQTISSVTPTQRNIHALEAVSERAILLSIQGPLCRLKQQSWYFPVTFGSANSGQTAYNRLIKPVDQQAAGKPDSGVVP